MIFLRAFRAANFTLGGLSFEDLTQKNMNLLEVQFHKIVEFQRQDMYVYIYI